MSNLGENGHPVGNYSLDRLRRVRGAILLDKPQAGKSEAPVGLGGNLRQASSIFAPVTVVSSLLLYVGWIRSRAYYDYFGVSADSLKFGPQDYLFRSGDIGLGALLLTLLSLGAFIAFGRMVQQIERRRPGVEERVRFSLALMGLAVSLYSLVDVRQYAAVAAVPPVLDAVLLTVGAALFMQNGSTNAKRRGVLGSQSNWIAILVLTVSIFWIGSIYARAVGSEAAASDDQNPNTLPVATVYSDTPLDIPGNIVRASRIELADSKMSYRYTGAKVLTYGNGKFFLITSSANHDYHSRILMLQEAENIRVEVAAPREIGGL
jgi:hypothetical protein